MQELCTGTDYGECVERQPITGVWELSPQRRPGTELLVGARSRGPLKLKIVGFVLFRLVTKFATF